METGLFKDILTKLERSNQNQKNTIEKLLQNEEISSNEKIQLNEIRLKNEEINKALKNKDLNKLQKLMEDASTSNK